MSNSRNLALLNWMEWNGTLTNVNANTCICPTVSCQNDCCEKSLFQQLCATQLRWFGHLVRMPPGRFPREVFQARLAGRRPRGDQGSGGGTISPHWPGNASGSLSQSLNSEFDQVNGKLCVQVVVRL